MHILTTAELWVGTITLAKIITNIMPTHVKTTIKYSLHQLFLKLTTLYV